MKLLEHIEQNKYTTQQEIANAIDSSLAMVNNYISQFETQDYLKREYHSSKTVNYQITSKGIKRKKYLQITYIKELMERYIEGQASARQFLQSIVDKGFHKILLYGAGEVAEIILDIIQTNDLNLHVVGIIDDDKQKQNTTLRSYPICDKTHISHMDHDAIVITSFAYEEQILETLCTMNYPDKQVIKYFEVLI